MHDDNKVQLVSFYTKLYDEKVEAYSIPRNNCGINE